jgi:sterol desaturase/sphingolipid hydroxylase (fatty acid hydroxylase superfamily)
MNISKIFADGPNLVQWILFAVTFIVCWNLEYLFGVSKNYNKWKQSLTNILFAPFGALMQFLLGFVFVKVLWWENANGYGILPRLNIMSNWQQIAVSFIVLDFFYWVYHYLMHKVGFAWRFHAVHHSDTVMNVSTTLREHPGETLIRLGHYMLVTWALGTSFWIITLHQFIQILTKIIVHSNWRLPDKLDKYVSMVFLTPNMHHVHHHHEQPYTDSNFGDLFSIWDRMFGTFRYLPKEQVKFGLDVEHFDDEKNLKFKNLITVPFTKENLSND